MEEFLRLDAEAQFFQPYFSKQADLILLNL
jgi:hypothetical protein